MRIIAGKHRGIRLAGPDKSATRPTSDRVKEALFNILMREVEQSRFLDLFAGTGGIGIEALSRGAAEVVFVDIDRNALRVLRQNLGRVPLDKETYEVFHNSAEQAVDHLAARGKSFDIIFLDAPYAMETVGFLIQKIITEKIITKYGKIIVEHDKRTELPERVKAFRRTAGKKYGNTVLSIYEAEEQA